ncbi:unnamed protein product [Adineta ricciae]|uniref:Uncharacterized protein n=1 Tax=Adineta ricciae TaxID=249248 RepID=A0A814MV91_ADIRI|nr:unnamed protein product [Adineta ricciae]
MDLDPMINISQDENTYSDYDDRPIRPMDQDALNEALARLPILVDEDELSNHSESSSSVKARRQPVLAYSTRRKDFTGVNVSSSVLNTTQTPMNNKRKLTGNTPTNKYIKQLDSRHDLIQLKEENKILEEGKANLQLECVLLKKLHENEIELLNREHQQAIEALAQEHNLQREQFLASLAEKEQLLAQTNLELDNLRNDHTMLLLEKETLDNIVAEYALIKQEMNNKLLESETTIKNLRQEIENLSKPSQPMKQISISNDRMVPKESSSISEIFALFTFSIVCFHHFPAANRPRVVKNEQNRPKPITKVPAGRGLITALSTTASNLNKPAFSTATKLNGNIDDKKKVVKQSNPSSARLKPKIVPIK